jgi:MFS family permease
MPVKSRVIEIKKQLNSVRLLAAITAICLLSDSMLYIVLPLYYVEAGLTSLWQVGVLLSVNRLIRLPLNPFIEKAYTRFGLRGCLMVSAITTVLITLGYSLAGGFVYFLVLRCLWGIVWAFLRLGGFFLLAETTVYGNRGKLTGTYNGLFRLGSLFGMLGGGVCADQFGFMPTALGFALLTGTAIPLVFLFIAGYSDTAIRSTRVNRSIVWDKPLLITLGTGLLVSLVYQGVFASILSHYIQSVFTDRGYVGIALAGTLAGGILALRWAWEPWAAPWIGHISDGSRNRTTILIVSLSASGLLFALLSFSTPFAAIIPILLGILIAGTFLTTLSDTLSGDLAFNRSKVVMTYHAMSTDLGASLGPFAAFLMVSAAGTEVVFLCCAIAMIVTALVWRSYSARWQAIME